ncbi:MAG: DUF5995 family protein [Actinomycetota bacterium]|nr:DUF5995 family protein [Actinomycetota bacterium]
MHRQKPHQQKPRLAAYALSLSLLIAFGTGGGSAGATDPIYVGWSHLLPPWTNEFNPDSQNACRAGRLTCVKQVIKKMDRRFIPQAENCHHNAVFSLAYLRTTEEYARTAAQPGAFDDTAFVNHEDAVFAEFYFQAYDAWAEGRKRAVPAAWQIAFRAAQNRTVAGTGNLFLGMNAHVNRDLPFVLAGLGLVAPDGTSRKPDHDRINKMLNRVVEPLLAEESARFDPTMDDVNTPYGVSYTAMLQVLVGWREDAWRNAERLVAAPNAQARALVAQDIEDYAAVTARSLVGRYQYNPPLTTSAERDAYCASQNS